MVRVVDLAILYALFGVGCYGVAFGAVYLSDEVPFFRERHLKVAAVGALCTLGLSSLAFALGFAAVAAVASVR